MSPHNANKKENEKEVRYTYIVEYKLEHDD